MKVEIELTPSEWVDLTSPRVSDEEKLVIFKRKFNALARGKIVMDLLNDLHVRYMDYFAYISKNVENVDVETVLEAYKTEFIKVEDDLKYYLTEIVEKGIDDSRTAFVNTDIYCINNLVRRAYDKIEEIFCDSGLAFADLNEKRIGIDNCIDKIVSEFVICFDSDEDLLRDAS